MIDEIIKIIEIVKNKISDSSEIIWTRYESAKEFKDELDTFITRLKANDKSCLEDLNILFLPTGTIQEHSISNGWANEYLVLAEQFDKMYNQLKK